MKALKIIGWIVLVAMGIVAAWYAFCAGWTRYMLLATYLFDQTWPIVRWFGVSDSMWTMVCRCAPMVLFFALSLFLNVLKNTCTHGRRIRRLEERAREEEARKRSEVMGNAKPDRRVA